MWFEKRLIRFAGPPEGLQSQAPDDDKEKERRLKDGTKGALHVQEEAVGKSAIEQAEKPKSPFDGIKDFEKRFDSVRSEFATLEKLGLKERAELIVNIRRRIMELKFLMRYLAENEFVEIVDGHHIYTEGENSKLDLTASAEEIKNFEIKLAGVKAEDAKKEIYLYADLEKTKNTIKPRDFLKLPLADRLRLVSNIKSWDDLKEETLVVFDFGTNEALEYQIGLGDLMPPEIRKISMGGSVYERRATQGFYNSGRYLSIFDGSKVKIEGRSKDYAEKNESDIAKSFGVDAFLLEAISSVVGADPDNNISDTEEFLHIAARYIQNAEAKFDGKAIEAGHYSVRFLAYAMDRFNLFAEHAGKNPNLNKVVEKYAALRGIELKVDEKVELAREAERPRTIQEVEKIGGRSKYQGEIAYSPVDVSKGTEDMRQRMDLRLKSLRAELSAQGVPEKYHTAVLAKARAAYEMMIARMGSAFRSTVGIRRPDGSMWNITNNCVGAAMKNMENTGFQVLRGRQAGKQAANFYWGTYRGGGRDFVHYAWLRTMIPDDSYMINAHVTPENCDSLIGQHLATGECAPAGLWNHAFWIYKDFNGVVMICHSGADVRPSRIKVEGEMPPGYRKVGGWYVKNKGSKLNEVPLSYFLARTQKNYAPPRNGLRFVPLTKLFMGNLEGQPMV